MAIRNFRKPVLFTVQWSELMPRLTMLKGTPPRLVYFMLGFSLGLCVVALLVTWHPQPAAAPECRHHKVLELLAHKLLDNEEDSEQVKTPAHLELPQPHQAPSTQQQQASSTEGVISSENILVQNSAGGGSVAEELYSRVRILCWIMTYEDNLSTKATAIRDTWAKRCHVVLYVSDQENKHFPTININVSSGRPYLSHKTVAAFDYIAENHLNDADWFLKADDDTYVIMENLRYFLSQENASEPVYFGHPFRPWVDQGYFSGGSGYIISKAALQRYNARPQDLRLCQGRYGGAEDVVWGRCMEHLGVRTGDSRDKLSRSRFHAMDAGAHMMGNFPEWYYFYDALHGQSGAGSISDYSISFHYVKPKDMYVMEFFVYQLRPYGLIDSLQKLNRKDNG